MKATRKEKLLTIALLKEKLERVSGKKVMFKEENSNSFLEELASYFDERGMEDTLDNFSADQLKKNGLTELAYLWPKALKVKELLYHLMYKAGL